VHFSEIPIEPEPENLSEFSADDLDNQVLHKRSSYHPWSVQKKNYLDLSEVSAVLNQMIGNKGGGSSSSNSIKMKPVRFSLGG
jgi:hypothetical protein